MKNKKIVLLPLAAFAILGLVGCANNASSASDTSTGTSAKSESASTSSSASQSASNSSSSSSSSSSSESSSASTSSSSEEPIKEQTIGDISKAGTYDVKGVVVAKNKKGFVLHDGKDGILVYLNAVPTQQIGDVVEVTDTLTDGTYMTSTTAGFVTATTTGAEFAATKEFDGNRWTLRASGASASMPVYAGQTKTINSVSHYAEQVGNGNYPSTSISLRSGIIKGATNSEVKITKIIAYFAGASKTSAGTVTCKIGSGSTYTTWTT